jgi:hypothetical protein
MGTMNTLELYRLSREEILDRYLVHNQLRFFFRAFIPWKIETSMKGLGPRIHESWKRHAQKLGLSNLRMAKFDDVLKMLVDLIRDELRTPPADVRPELWMRWVDDLVWRLPYVEHAVNAHFLWALAVLSPERLALLWSTVLQVNAGNSLWPHGEGGIPHEMQVDGLLFGPEVGVCLEMKVRGVGRGPSKLTANQLGKYEWLGERLRMGPLACTGKQLHLAILLPESAASAATTGEFMEALALSSAPVGRSPTRRVAA